MNIGIDFGTSNTIVAYEYEGEIQYLEYPDSAHLSGRQYVLPSEVFIPDWEDEDNAVYVGGYAEKEFQNRKGKIVTSPKSSIGSTEVLYDEDGEIYISKDIVKMVMDKIYQRLKEVFPDETIFQAIVAIPVTFNTNEIKELLEAVQEMYNKKGEGICLSEIKTVHEPIAAYLACKDYEEKDLCNAKTIMVIDMGGGTLDISEVKRVYSGGKSAVTAKRLGGKRKLGGDNFDKVVAQLITEKINMSRGGDHVEMEAAYLEKIERYSRVFKEKLQYKREKSDKERVNLNLFFTKNQDQFIEISREEYYEKADDLIKQVTEEIDRALRISDETYERVLVVGGMSAEPFLQEYVREKFGKEKTIILNPSDENFYGIVAKGAAIINGNTDLTVCNRMLYSIGIKEADGRIDTIFEANTELNKLEVIREYEPAQNNCYSIRLPVVEFEKKDGAAEDKKYTIITELLTITIDNIPQGKKEDQIIIVKFRIDDDRSIKVNAYVKSVTEKKCECKIVF